MPPARPSRTTAAPSGWFSARSPLLTLVGIVAAIYLIRDVSRGIASIIAPMRALGQGDLSAVVPHRGENTEIGQMADTLQVFKDALIAKKAADEAAAADAEAKIQRGQRVDAITREFEAMVGKMVSSLSSASTELEAAANTLTEHRRVHPAAVGLGRLRLARSLRQRAIGRRSLRGDHLLGQRDQPPGAGVEP